MSVVKGTLAPSAKQRELTDDGYSSSTDIAAEQRADNDLRGILRRERNAVEASACNRYVYEQGEQILSTLNCQERPCRNRQGDVNRPPPPNNWNSFCRPTQPWMGTRQQQRSCHNGGDTRRVIRHCPYRDKPPLCEYISDYHPG